MEEHSNGRENATQLEQRLRDQGVLYQSLEGHGFIVIGDTRVFIVEEESVNDVESFSFREIPMEHIQEFKVKHGKPTDRYEDMDNAEKLTDGGKPTTKIRLWLRSGAVECFVDADPREVASSFVTHTMENRTET